MKALQSDLDGGEIFSIVFSDWMDGKFKWKCFLDTQYAAGGICGASEVGH